MVSSLLIFSGCSKLIQMALEDDGRNDNPVGPNNESQAILQLTINNTGGYIINQSSPLRIVLYSDPYLTMVIYEVAMTSIDQPYSFFAEDLQGNTTIYILVYIDQNNEGFQDPCSDLYILNDGQYTSDVPLSSYISVPEGQFTEFLIDLVNLTVSGC